MGNQLQTASNISSTGLSKNISQLAWSFPKGKKIEKNEASRCESTTKYNNIQQTSPAELHFTGHGPQLGSLGARPLRHGARAEAAAPPAGEVFNGRRLTGAKLKLREEKPRNWDGNMWAVCNSIYKCSRQDPKNG